MDTIIADTLQHPKIASSRTRQILVSLIICVILYLLIDAALTKYVNLMKHREPFAAGTVGVYNSPLIQAGEVAFAANSYKVNISGTTKTAEAYSPPDIINWMEIVTFDQPYKSAPIIQLNMIGLQLLTKANFNVPSKASAIALNPTEESFIYSLKAIDVTATGFKCVIDIKYSLYPNFVKVQWAAIGFAKTPIFNVVYETASAINVLSIANASRIAGSNTLSVSKEALGNRSLTTEKSGFVTHRLSTSAYIPYKVNTAVMTPIILMGVVPKFWNTPFTHNLAYSIKSGDITNETVAGVVRSKFSINMNLFRPIVPAGALPSVNMSLSWLVIYAT